MLRTNILTPEMITGALALMKFLKDQDIKLVTKIAENAFGEHDEAVLFDIFIKQFDSAKLIFDRIEQNTIKKQPLVKNIIELEKLNDLEGEPMCVGAIAHTLDNVAKLDKLTIGAVRKCFHECECDGNKYIVTPQNFIDVIALERTIK